MSSNTPSSSTTPASQNQVPVISAVQTDVLVLNMAEQAWEGDAEFQVFLDGVAVGGLQTVTALEASGQSQSFTYTGNFGTGVHDLGIEFVNDAYGGTATEDRNLYMVSASLNGQQILGSIPMLNGGGYDRNFTGNSASGTTGNHTPTLTGTAVAGSKVAISDTVNGNTSLLGSVVAGANGAWSFTTPTLTNGTNAFSATDTNSAGLTSLASPITSININTILPAAPVISAVQTDVLVLNMAEQAWQGDAEFQVFLDGVAVGGLQTVTALEASGQSQSFTYTGNFGTGVHDLGIEFVNDASDGTAANDRNLYMVSASLNGQQILGSMPMLNGGGYDLYFTGNSASGTTGNHTPTLTGTAVAGSKVAISDTVNGNTSLLGSVVAGANGAWSFTTPTLTNGTNAFSATDTNSAGLTSLASAAASISVQPATTIASVANIESTVYIGGDVGLSDLADTDNTQALLATGAVGLYMQESAVNSTYSAGTLGSIVKGMAGTGSGEAELNLQSAGNVAEWFATEWQTVWLSSGLRPSAINSIVNFSLPTWQADFDATVVEARAYGITTVAPIFSPNSSSYSLTDFASNPAYASIRQAALYGGGLTIDAPPGYFFQQGSDYQTFTYDEIKWANANHLKTTVIISPYGDDANFTNDVASFVNLLEFNGATPSDWVVENYSSDPTTIGSDKAPNTLANAALWIANNAATVFVDPAPVISAVQTDVLVLNMAEQAWEGDAEFQVFLDGVAVGGLQTVTALEASGQSQSFTYTGNFGTGVHDLGIEFVNDAYGGTATEDRNLYMVSASLNGQQILGSIPMLNGGGYDRNFTDNSTTASGTTGNHTPTLTGTAVAGSKVAISDTVNGNTSLLGSVVAGANGAWSFTTPTLTNGTNAFSATDTNSAGLTSLASPITSININTILPAAPVISAVQTDVLVLNMAEQAWQGDAEFQVFLDGVAVGGLQTVTALEASGQSQSFTYTGNFGTGVHDLGIEFVNDAYGGTATEDRNLYMVSASLNGQQILGSIPMLNGGGYDRNFTGNSASGTTGNHTPTLTGTAVAGSKVAISDTVNGNTSLLGSVVAGANGAWSFTTPTLTNGTNAFSATDTNSAGLTSLASPITSININTILPAAPVISAVQTDVLVLNMAEQAWQGDAEFQVFLDGVAVGGLQTVTALEASGQSQSFTYTGNFGTGVHDLGIEFVNDAYGGTATEDRNLYMVSASLNGQQILGSIPMLNGGGYDRNFTDNSTTASGTTGNHTPTLTGTAVAGSKVAISDTVNGNTSLLGSVVAGANGAWSFTTPTLTNGTNAFSATDTNSAGLTSLASPITSININTILPAAPVISAVQTDVLVLNMAEQAWQGDAEFQVFLDGVAVGGLQTVTALEASGQSQSFTYTGNFGTGVHDLGIEFVNDAYGGTATEDRNLYMVSASLNGQQILGSIPMLNGGGYDRNFTGNSASGTTGNHTPTLTGTAVAGSKVAISDTVNGNTSLLGSVVAGANGAWSFTTPTLTNGTNAFSATDTNSAGLTSLASPITSINISAAASPLISGEVSPLAEVSTTSTSQMSFISSDTMVKVSSGAVLTDSTGSHDYVLPASGSVSFIGNSLASNDTFDFSAALANTGWDGRAGDLGSYISETLVNSGSNLLISTHTNSGSGALALTLVNQANLSLTQLHAIF